MRLRLCFPRRLMSKFKSFKQTCALVREAQKEQHRVTEFLAIHTPIETAKLSAFDDTGTLSHLLLLYLTRLEKTATTFPRLRAKPPPALTETDAERKTAFCQERRRSSQRKIRSKSDQEKIRTPTPTRSGDRRRNTPLDSTGRIAARTLLDKSITRSANDRKRDEV